jgi:hypothetical protein
VLADPARHTDSIPARVEEGLKRIRAFVEQALDSLVQPVRRPAAVSAPIS